MNSYKSGYLAEYLAVWYLRLKGYSLVCRNYKSGRGNGVGEVDLIVKKRGLIVFVEVKKRANISLAAEAISTKQQQRISNGAKVFLQKHKKYQGLDVRFDAVLISFPFSIEHIKNAW